MKQWSIILHKCSSVGVIISVSLHGVGAVCILKQVSDEKNRENKSPVLCSSVNWMFYLCLHAWKKKEMSQTLS